MTLIVPAARFTEFLARVESAIEADQFVELRFTDPVVAHTTKVVKESPMEAVEPPLQHHPRRNGTTIMPGQAARSRGAVASSRAAPPPPVRAPYIRSEQHYRRRGSWLEWQEPSAWKRWLAAVVWCWLAVQVAAWAIR